MSTAPKLPKEFFNFESMELSSTEFQFFAKKMYELSGVHLPENDKNRALMKNRLAKLLRKFSITSYQGLVDHVRLASTETLSEFISALTTNKTDFFREKSHFDFLEKKLRTHFEKHDELRIWCAAASTGQEPYTLAMVCAEHLKPADLKRTKILATDIDLDALQKGADGFYLPNEMAGTPPALQSKYFEDFAGQLRAKDILTNLISFCPFNLVKDSYQFRQPFHFVFCRNVLIYFDEATCTKVIDGLISALAPAGHLFLGHSEAGVMKSPRAESLTGAVFRRKS
jgi:chemotaxis protein methyltransferase CheR